MSMLVGKSMLTPLHLEPLPAQSPMYKSLKSHPLVHNPQPITSNLNCQSSPLSNCSSLSCQNSQFASKGWATPKRVLIETSKSNVRSQRNEDGNFVSPTSPDEVSEKQEVSAPSSMAGKPLFAKLGQSINVAGIAFSSRVILRERHLAIPHVSVPDISWIDWKALKTKGFEAVLFDKDNTLTAPYGESVWPSLLESLEECRTVFDGRIALLSNSAGLYQFDPEGAEAKALEDKIGISVIRHGSKKPSGNAEALAKYFGCDPSLVVMVGDRYFTDIVYGNNNGLLTIRPAPLTSNGEPFVVRRVRALEDTLVDWWRNQGVAPTEHRLFDHPVDFIKDPGFW